MYEVLIFIVGFVVGVFFVALTTGTSDARAVRLGVWVYNGVAYQLNRFEGGKTDGSNT